jgi:hypothetical protein
LSLFIKPDVMRSCFFLPAFTGLFLLQSCGAENQPAEPETVQLQDSALGEIDAPFLPGDTVTTTANIDSLMADFPKKWLQIERKGKDLVYTEYCNMEHPYVEIEKVEGNWKIHTVYGHDGESWEVLDMMKSESTALGQQLVEGQFIVKKLTYPDEEIYHSNFFWNKTAGTCSFGDFFAPDKIFADETLQKTFVIKKEPCDS